MEVRTTGVPVIGARELRRAADILRRYKQGKQNLERRIIADEDWWKLRQWRQFSDKGNPNDDRPRPGGCSTSSWASTRMRSRPIRGRSSDRVSRTTGRRRRCSRRSSRAFWSRTTLRRSIPTRAGRR